MLLIHFYQKKTKQNKTKQNKTKQTNKQTTNKQTNKQNVKHTYYILLFLRMNLNNQ